MLAGKSLKNFAILFLLVTVNSTKLGTRFHSFTANTQVDAFIKLEF